MNPHEQAIRSQIQAAHESRAQIWQNKDIEGYLAYYWNEAVLVADGSRITIPEFHQWLDATFSSGGGSLSFYLPELNDIEISSLGDAVTTVFEWRQRFRTSDGEVSDRTCLETNVWYQRHHVWKIIRLHLTTISKVLIRTE